MNEQGRREEEEDRIRFWDVFSSAMTLLLRQASNRKQKLFLELYKNLFSIAAGIALFVC